MKTKNKLIALVEIAVVLCSVFLVALPAIASEQTTQKVSANTITTTSKDDYVLDIYGNANEDDTIDMGDVVYTKLAIFGKKSKTELCDAKYDGRINVLDVIQTKLIILGKEKELTFVDVIEEAETIRKPVERIIIVVCDAPEVLRALNAGDKIVGVTGDAMKDGVFFPGLSKLPFVAGNWRNMDYEAVLSLQPDVLIPYTPHAKSKSVWPSVKQQKAELKEKLPGVSIVALDFMSLPTFTENVRKLGYIIDKEDEAEVFANWHDRYINTIKERTEGLSEDEKPRVFTMTYGKYKTGIPGSRYHQRMVLAGGRNIAADIPIPPGGSTTSVTVDPEWVITQNPDVITKRTVIQGYSKDDPADLIATWEDVMNTPELANVNAVKNRRVYSVGNSLLTGAHGPIVLTYYAKWFHPELFKDLDPKAIHQEYLTEFQGLNYNLREHGVFVYHPEEHPDG